MRIISVDEVRELVDLWEQNIPVIQIAEIMGLDGKQISSLVSRLRMAGYKLTYRRKPSMSCSDAVNNFVKEKS